jgi:hypothetical protein
MKKLEFGFFPKVLSAKLGTNAQRIDDIQLPIVISVDILASCNHDNNERSPKDD